MCDDARVDRQRALQVLHLGADASVQDARDSYRQLVRSSHPDLIGSDGNEAMILLNQAMAALESEAEMSAESSVDVATRPGSWSEIGLDDPGLVILDDGLTLAAPADELFGRLAEALDEIGDLTYADASSGYLEAAVAMGNPSPSQLVVSLQGRGEATEAFFTLESMGVETPPDLATVVAAIGEILARTAT